MTTVLTAAEGRSEPAASEHAAFIRPGKGRWLHALASPLALMLLVAGLLGAGWWTIASQIRAQQRSELVGKLETVHINVRRSVLDWVDQQLALVRVVVSDEDVRTAVLSLAEPTISVEWKFAKAIGENRFRSYMSNLQSTRGVVSFELVDRDGQRLMTADNSGVSTRSPLTKQPDVMQRLLDGEEAISRPLVSDLLLPDQLGELASGRPVIYAGAPIADRDGHVTAIVLLALDPSREFERRIARGTIGRTGETVALDATGHFVSATRFDDVLVQLGYLSEESPSAALQLRAIAPPENLSLETGQRLDPLVLDDLPLTRAAAGAAAAGVGIDLDGYRNIRGRRAVGKWSWLPTVGIGLVTQIEFDEAWYANTVLQRVIASLFVAAIALTLTLGLVMERRRRSGLVHAEELRRTAYFDSLTQLPNRRLFRIELEQAMDLAVRHDHLMALMFLDLDDFKRVNDSLGHDVGDELLKHVASRINSLLRRSDVVSRYDSPTDADMESGAARVARLGGDEFTIILARIGSVADAHLVAERVLASLAETIELKGHPVVVSPSIGVAVGPADGADPDTLIKNADTAMYVAKNSGKNRYSFFSASMSEAASERMDLESRLREAIDADRIETWYQPKLDCAGDAVCSVEALVRWYDALHGQQPPDRFIPIAEASGQIIPLGKQVLYTACRDAASWTSGELANASVAVNVAALQFADDGFVEMVEEALADSGLAASRLVLELTERVVLGKSEEVRERLAAIKALGVQVSIDDFGTGYSSFAYLTQFPIDEIKIDKSMIDAVPGERAGEAIVLAIVAMASSLGMRTVAEGVETQLQARWLEESQVTLLQGWLYAKALPRQELEAWVADRASLSTRQSQAG